MQIICKKISDNNQRRNRMPDKIGRNGHKHKAGYYPAVRNERHEVTTSLRHDEGDGSA